VDVPITIRGMARKSTGLGGAGQLGLLINATNLDPVGGNNSQTAIWSGSTTNEAQNGAFVVQISPRRTSYERAITGYMSVVGSSVVGQVQAPATANMPIATITTIGIRARTTVSTATFVFVRDVEILIGQF
jgi:hypothetical protein